MKLWGALLVMHHWFQVSEGPREVLIPYFLWKIFYIYLLASSY
jgi:hypothetical protein